MVKAWEYNVREIGLDPAIAHLDNSPFIESLATSNGEIPTGLKGVVHKSLIAINTVVESLETGYARSVQNSSSAF